MKNILSLTVVVSALLLAAPVASANEFVTLSDSSESLELKKGETALVVSASQEVTIQYQKKTWPVRTSQFKLAAIAQNNQYNSKFEVGPTPKKRYVPSWEAPFVLAGPCKIKLVSSGVVGMRVVAETKAK